MPVSVCNMSLNEVCEPGLLALSDVVPAVCLV